MDFQPPELRSECLLFKSHTRGKLFQQPEWTKTQKHTVQGGRTNPAWGGSGYDLKDKQEYSRWKKASRKYSEKIDFHPTTGFFLLWRKQGWCLCYICISEDYNRALDLAMKLCTSSKDFQIKENPSPEALIKNLSSSSIHVIKDEVTLMWCLPAAGNLGNPQEVSSTLIIL